MREAGQKRELKKMIEVNKFMNKAKTVLLEKDKIIDDCTKQVLHPTLTTAANIMERPYKVFSKKIGDVIIVESLADHLTIYKTIKRKYPEHE